MGRWSIAETRSKAKDYGARLRRLGVSVVFAPVADLDVPGRYMSSLERCFSASPKVAGLHVVAWSSGLRSAGVIPTVKHWPGHGHASDTHGGAARVPSLSVLRKSDMLPFERAFEAGVPMVMVGHLRSSGLTGARTPASLSRNALQYLRSRVGPDVVIITDSLSMASTTQALGIGSPAAAVRALRAGADFALVCSAPPEKVIGAVTSAIRSGRLPRTQAEASARRVLRLKARSGLAPNGAGSLPPRAASGALVGQVLVGRVFHDMPESITARTKHLEELDARDRAHGMTHLQRLRQVLDRALSDEGVDALRDRSATGGGW